MAHLPGPETSGWTTGGGGGAGLEEGGLQPSRLQHETGHLLGRVDLIYIFSEHAPRGKHKQEHQQTQISCIYPSMIRTFYNFYVVILLA